MPNTISVNAIAEAANIIEQKDSVQVISQAKTAFIVAGVEDQAQQSEKRHAAIFSSQRDSAVEQIKQENLVQDISQLVTEYATNVERAQAADLLNNAANILAGRGLQQQAPHASSSLFSHRKTETEQDVEIAKPVPRVH